MSILYGPVETHTSPAKGGSLDNAANPRRKILTDPKEVRDFMRKHMVTIYKKQENLTPEEDHVLSFLRGMDDKNVMDALEKKKLKENQKHMLEGEITKAELETQLH